MNYKKGPIIGRGSTATVLRATTVTGGLVAVKSTELSSSHFLQKEQQLLSKLSSPHVIKYIGSDIDYTIDNNPMYNLVMEYANGGSLLDVIKSGGGCVDECLIKSYTYQILLGLDYIHSNNLVHCDIKCSNILVCDKNVVKIGDFGCAKYVGEHTSSVFSGTPVFMAPEVARGEEQMFGADVWAVGCAVVEMATGRNPWPELNNPVSALYRIGYSDDIPFFPMWLSFECQDFLKKCLQRKVEERWTVKELLEHPFVSSKSCFEKIENFSKNNSPVSNLDQGFWDSLEETDSSPESVSGQSPMERIRQLVETSPSCLPNWVEENDWIAVRISHIDEIAKISEHDLYTDVDVEDNEDIDLSHTYSISGLEIDVLEEMSNSFMVMVGSDVDETSSAIVVAPSFLDCKNMINDNRLQIDSILRCFYIVYLENKSHIGNDRTTHFVICSCSVVDKQVENLLKT
uniref:mitogen-activated protein kinase kinase kinase 18-like n=1 Tax=Erigeron canadensis TaxID=72917 RepID=UPI001CB9710B|nr:mitogen-activated protein kinase kinase kinase 18-like [Erigeron canadensis]